MNRAQLEDADHHLAAGPLVVVSVLVLADLMLATLVPHILVATHGDRTVLLSAVGLYGGQITLVGLWSAAASNAWISRVPWALLAASAIWCGILFGFELAAEPLGSIAYQAVGLTIFAGVVGVQIPFWFASARLGWRLISPGATVRSERHFDSTSLFLGVTLLACALGISRRFAPADDWRWLQIDLELTFLVGVGIAVNIVTAGPTIGLAFFEGVTFAGIGLWLAYLSGCSAVEFFVLAAWLGPPTNKSGEVLMTLTLFNLVQGATVYLTLRLMRQCGFRLVHHATASSHAGP